MNSQSNTTALAQQQHDLLHAIFTTNNIATQAINTPARDQINPLNRGLQTYQANAAASAQRSLQAALEYFGGFRVDGVGSAASTPCDYLLQVEARRLERTEQAALTQPR